MTRTPLWIKICANTSLADSLLAAQAGADAVGFVFAPSARRVTVEQVASIAPQLPANLEKIGVFVNTQFEEIAATAEHCRLTGVQLHWDAPVELAAQLRERFGAGLRIVRTVHLNAKGSDPSAAQAAGKPDEPLAAGLLLDPLIDAILIDSRTASAVGGTGRTFDWQIAATTIFRDAGDRRFIAAGGLSPENVAEAIATLRPWGVDVASGVEFEPGRKDPARLKAFIRNAREA